MHGFDADTLSYNITIPQGKDANAAASSVKAIMSDATQVSAVANENVATVNNLESKEFCFSTQSI